MEDMENDTMTYELRDAIAEGLSNSSRAHELEDVIDEIEEELHRAMKGTVDVELVVFAAGGARLRRYSCRDVDSAQIDAKKYAADLLGRTARVRSRTVMTSKWEWESDE